MQRMRRAAVLAIALGLAALPATASPREPAWETLAHAWSWLSALLPFQPAVQAACDESSYIDPNGRCRAGFAATAAPAPAAPDESSLIDPNG